MAQHEESDLVADGCARARAACAPGIRARVEQQFAEELAQAHWLKRLLVRRKIRREIARLLDEQAPPGALYLAARGKP